MNDEEEVLRTMSWSDRKQMDGRPGPLPPGTGPKGNQVTQQPEAQNGLMAEGKSSRFL